MKKQKKTKKLKYSLWEKLDFLTGKKIVICNHPDDVKLLKPYFPIGTQIAVKAAGPRGAYYVVDMESLRRTAHKLAPSFQIPKPETTEINWDQYKFNDGNVYSNIVVRIESETGSRPGGKRWNTK